MPARVWPPSSEVTTPELRTAHTAPCRFSLVTDERRQGVFWSSIGFSVIHRSGSIVVSGREVVLGPVAGGVEVYPRMLFCLLVTACLSACSPLNLINALVPDNGHKVSRDVAYGTEARQRLDIYVPANLEGDASVVIFLYGGSWKRGDKAQYRFVGEALAERGTMAVLPDYRVFPEARFPTFVEDAARALSWVADNIDRWGGNPDRLYLMGHSAGAHIAALLTLDEHYMIAVGLPKNAVKGTIGLAGPYAFDPLAYGNIRPIFAHLADPDAARPVSFVDGTEPPMLLLHGADDLTVRPTNSMALFRAIRGAGGEAKSLVYPDVGHSGILLSLSGPLRELSPAFDDSVAFIEGR